MGPEGSAKEYHDARRIRNQAATILASRELLTMHAQQMDIVCFSYVSYNLAYSEADSHSQSHKPATISRRNSNFHSSPAKAMKSQMMSPLRNPRTPLQRCTKVTKKRILEASIGPVGLEILAQMKVILGRVGQFR